MLVFHKRHETRPRMITSVGDGIANSLQVFKRLCALELDETVIAAEHIIGSLLDRWIVIPLNETVLVGMVDEPQGESAWRAFGTELPNLAA
jgi:hypothetical protein